MPSTFNLGNKTNLNQIRNYHLYLRYLFVNTLVICVSYGSSSADWWHMPSLEIPSKVIVTAMTLVSLPSWVLHMERTREDGRITPESNEVGTIIGVEFNNHVIYNASSLILPPQQSFISFSNSLLPLLLLFLPFKPLYCFAGPRIAVQLVWL